MKNKKQRKVLCVILAMSLFILSGCGGQRLMMGTGGT